MWSGLTNIFQSIFSNENKNYSGYDNPCIYNDVYYDYYDDHYDDYYDDETYNVTNDVTNKEKKTDNVTYKVTNDVTNKERKINNVTYKVTNDVANKERKNEDKRKRDKQEQSGIFVSGGCSCRSPRLVVVPSYLVPKSYWSVFQKASEKLLRDNKELSYFRKELPISSHLNFKNYNEKFHSLLFIEEMHQSTEYEMYDIQETYLTRNSQYLCLKFKGIKEKNITVGSCVKVHYPCRKDNPQYEGTIEEISEDIIFMIFTSEFHKKYNGQKISVKFIYSSTSMQKCHFAIDLASERLGQQILFPKKICINPNKFEIKKNCLFDENLTQNTDTELILSNTNNLSNDLKLNWFNKNLNEVQKNAIVNVLSGATKPLPYIIFGPPGTGKTITLVELVTQIVTLFPKSKILIATPSNSAANLLTQRLIDSKNFNPGLLIRLVSLSHVSNENFPDYLKQYSATLSTSSKTSNTLSSGIRQKCITCTDQYRIVISTFGCVSSFMKIERFTGPFSHVIIDEAGQATEPDTMIPLGLINHYEGQIILAGDPMQLGPVVFSNVAKNLGLGISFLERLLTCSPYQKDRIRHGDENGGYDPRLVTKLKYNYRSIQSIINFSSNTFYDSGIISMLDFNSKEVQLDVNRLYDVFEMKENMYRSMIFHGVRGSNLKIKENPSSYNPEEASLVLSYLHKLYKGKYTAKDIGIITPYIQQVKHIQNLIKRSNIECPQIGSVEAFQGQEKKIIILSVVKSRSNISHNTYKALSFVKEPKRLNVALTRAQKLLITIGNPHLLCLDELWCSLIKYMILNGCYVGCPVPRELVSLISKNSDKTAQSQTKKYKADKATQVYYEELKAHFDETGQCNYDKNASTKPPSSNSAKFRKKKPRRRNRPDKTVQNETAQNNPDKTTQNQTTPTEPLSLTTVKPCKKKLRRRNSPNKTVQNQTAQNNPNKTTQNQTTPTETPSSTTAKPCKKKTHRRNSPDKTVQSQTAQNNPDKTTQNQTTPTEPLSLTTAKPCKKKPRRRSSPVETVQSQNAQNITQTIITYYYFGETAQCNYDNSAPTKPPNSNSAKFRKKNLRRRNSPDKTVQNQTAQNNPDKTTQNQTTPTEPPSPTPTKPCKTKPRRRNRIDKTVQSQTSQNQTAYNQTPQYNPSKTAQSLTK